MTGDFWAITGANGYLGRALRADLDRDGIGWRALQGDIRDASAVRALLRDAAVVVHLAAYVHKRGDDAECWSVNVDGTQTVIDAASAESFVIFVSTANVYGASAEPLDETSACNPTTAYGRSKLEAERRFLQAVRDGRFRGCVLRPAMIFGPGAPGNLAKLAKMARSGWVVEIGGGAARKSVVPVSHAVGAIRAAAAHPSETNSEVINVAGETLTMHEIIELLAPRKPRVISVPRWLVAPAARIVRLIETYITDAMLRGGKLERLTGFRPPEDVRDALRHV